MASRDWENWRKLSAPRRTLGRFVWRWQTIALVLTAVGLAMTSRHWQPLLVSWRVQRSLEAADDEEAAVILRQAMELGSPGMASVVGQLGSRRPSIRREAVATLQSEIDAWPRRPADDAARRSAQLAHALSDRIEGLSPLARIHAVRLSQDILRHADHCPAADNGALVAACRRVVTTAANSRPPGSPRDAVAGADRRDPVAASVQHSADSVADIGNDAQIAPRDRPERRAAWTPADSDGSVLPSPLPGGGIPVGPLPGPQQAASQDDLVQPAPKSAAPRLLELHEPVHPLPAALRDDRGDDVADGAEPTSASDPRDEPPLPAKPIGAESDASERDKPSEVIRLLSRLHDEDADARAAVDARRQLSERGFTPQQIEIGMHLTSPDPRQRRRWTEMLPRLSGIEAKPWLLWLSRDADAQVRLAAVSLMATTSDPQMLSRVREVARDDEDERVRESARRIGDGTSSDSRR